MQPIVILLLGASEPKTDEGTIAGKPTATEAAAERIKNSLRVSAAVFLEIVLFMKLSFRQSSENSACAKKEFRTPYELDRPDTFS